MSLTFDQLVKDKTRVELRDQLLLAMQGVGYVTKVGPGEGWLDVAGVAQDDLEVVIKITVAGGLGTAEFQYSVDGGASFNGSDIAIPGGGSYTLPSSGVDLVFTNGPGEADNSFYVNDTFSFTLSTPTLPITSWHEGSTALTIIEKDAEANEDFALTIKRIGKGGFLLEAEDQWLDLLLLNMYNLRRNGGQVAKHTVRLTDAGNQGPTSITPGEVVVATGSGLRFSNSTSGTLTLGGTLDLTFDAERKGTAYNVGLGAINTLLTSLPGVTVTNPDLGSGSSITQQGTNPETNASAIQRAEARWPELGASPNTDVWVKWAKEADTSVTRAKARASSTVPGQVDVIIAGPGGALSGGIVATVQAYLDSRAILGQTPLVVSATALNFDVQATIYVKAGHSAAALAQATANLTALFQGGLNSANETLEGYDIGDGTDKVYLNQIIEQLQLAAYVRNVVMITPVADTIITLDHVAQLSPAPTITPVEY